MLVRSSVLRQTLQVSLRLLMEMNRLSNSLVSEALSSSYLSIDKSRRVCGVETEISIRQG